MVVVIVGWVWLVEQTDRQTDTLKEVGLPTILKKLCFI